MTYIFGHDAWTKVFVSDPTCKKNIWIYIKFSNDQEIFLKEYIEWLTIQDYCNKNKLRISIIGLRYRSHQIETNCEGCDGVYLIRSIKGEFGGHTKQCFTIGLLKEGIVDKTMWLTPELIEEGKSKDKVEDSFQEAIVLFE